MDKEYDVIIVGSGPAGASAARALTEHGLKTLILEKETLPRYKCCSGVLFGEAQELLKKHFRALPPDEVYCKPKIINAANIQVYREGEGFSQWLWEWPKKDEGFSKDYLNIWRDRFDHWLVLESGAAIIDDCPLRGFELEEEKVKVVAGRAGKEAIFFGKYLIGADGGNSKVRNILDPEFKKTYQEMTVNQVYHEYESIGFDEDKWRLFQTPDFGNVAASVHIKDNMLALCTGTTEGKIIKKHLERLIRLLETEYNTKVGKYVRQEGCVLNTMFVSGNFNQGRGKVLLTGEAAGFLHMNGAGIDTAIDSGNIAGVAISEALKHEGDAWQIYYDRTKDIRDHIRECAKRQQMFK